MAGKKLGLVLLTIIVTFGLWAPVSTVHAQGDVQVRVFVLMTDNDAPQLAQVQAFIKAHGGRTLHTFPHRAVIAQVPAATIQPLAALPGVDAVFDQAMEPSTVDSYDSNARRFASVWNSLVASQAAASNVNLMAGEHQDEPNDAFTAPDLLSADRMGIAATTSVTPGYYQTS